MMSTHLNRLRTELSRLEAYLVEAHRQPGADRYRLVDLKRKSSALREQLWSAELALGQEWRPRAAVVRRRKPR